VECVEERVFSLEDLRFQFAQLFLTAVDDDLRNLDRVLLVLRGSARRIFGVRGRTCCDHKRAAEHRCCNRSEEGFPDLPFHFSLPHTTNLAPTSIPTPPGGRRQSLTPTGP